MGGYASLSEKRKTMNNTIQHRQIGENKVRIGNTVFLVRSYDTPTATQSPEQLMLKLLESKVKNHKEVKTA